MPVYLVVEVGKSWLPKLGSDLPRRVFVDHLHTLFGTIAPLLDAFHVQHQHYADGRLTVTMTSRQHPLDTNAANAELSTLLASDAVLSASASNDYSVAITY